VKKACAVGELCKLWANELDLCDSVLLICLSKSWVCGSSEEGDFALVMCAFHWGLIEPEDTSFGLRLVPLLCCWFDRQIPNHILSEWVRQRGRVVVGPFLFGDTKTTKNKTQCSNFKTYQLFKLWSHPNKCDRSKLNSKSCLLPLKKKNNHNANANTLKSSCIKVMHSSILLLLKYPWGTPHNFNYDLWRLLKTHDHTWWY
jgi:hypothetical protein